MKRLPLMNKIGIVIGYILGMLTFALLLETILFIVMKAKISLILLSLIVTILPWIVILAVTLFALRSSSNELRVKALIIMAALSIVFCGIFAVVDARMFLKNYAASQTTTTVTTTTDTNSFPLAKANEGDAEAMYQVGFYFETAMSGSRDYNQAFIWYKRAAEAGNGKAMYRIGRFYANGTAVKKDTETAFSWYEKAAQANNVDGLYTVGSYYDRGKVVDENKVTAVDYYQRAVDLGSAPAMNALGTLYLKGKGGVEKDVNKALPLFEKAADLNNMKACVNAGDCYVDGSGTEIDYKKALEYYKKAADLGSKDGCDKVGDMYTNGYGVKKDLDKAAEWYNKTINDL